VVLNQIGRVHFLQQRFGEAIETFRQVLLVVEDLQAHYNLMLCYQGLGNAALAAREQALYGFKADEAAQAYRPIPAQIARRQQRTQQIHEHGRMGAERRADEHVPFRRIECRRRCALRKVGVLRGPSRCRRIRCPRRSLSRTAGDQRPGSVRPQQRRIRKKYLPETLGAGGPFSTPTATDGRTFCSSTR
jgi:hypothetical protein